MSTSSPVLDNFNIEEQEQIVRLTRELNTAGVQLILDKDYRLMATKETAGGLTDSLKERVGCYKQVIADIILHHPTSAVLGGIELPEICPYCGERLREPFDVHPTDTRQRAMFRD